jgi:hypothetical protein
LYRAVARLALPAEDQLAYLNTIGVGDLADELALDLNDGLESPPRSTWTRPTVRS